VSARLAQHSEDEAKRYSTNCTYELCDTTAAALKLVSSPCAPLQLRAQPN